MRITKSSSKNSTTYYVSKSYRDKNGKCTSKIVERLGSIDDIRLRCGNEEPLVWARKYALELTAQEKEETRKVTVQLSGSAKLKKGEQRTYNGGYLFLQQLYYRLGLDRICSEISEKYKFDYDLNQVLSRLIFTRVLYPGSKLSAMEESKRFIEQPKFQLQHIYRALEVLAKESDFIQGQLFKNSMAVKKRNTGVIFYDCTNFFFEIEQEDENGGLRQYGHSKENRPNPIVQMGLFMDADGLPLSFCINPGNTAETQTLIPLEKKLHANFDLSEFVVCTDGGLSALKNRRYNSKEGRGFITVQSLKDNKIKPHLQEWALCREGWTIAGLEGTYSLDSEEVKSHPGRMIYKERWINENKLEQRLIVTYSAKYDTYCKALRQKQVERALRKIATGKVSKKKKSPNDCNRFIAETVCTSDGEVADKHIYSLDLEAIEKEARFDGFYAVCTNLEDDDAKEILRVNSWRWEIEDFFRILKSEFEARPVFLRRDDRILAHFITCFIALLIFKMLRQQLGCEETTTSELRKALVEMNFLAVKGDGWVPEYTPNNLTDRLHENAGFWTDTQLVTTKKMKAIIKATKS